MTESHIPFHSMADVGERLRWRAAQRRCRRTTQDAFRVLLVVFASLSATATSLGQEVTRSACPPAAVAVAEYEFKGVDACRRCHRVPLPEYKEDGDFVAMNESEVWLKDVHSQAYEFIKPDVSDLSDQICDQLQITDISQARQCLSCHANWLPDREQPPPTYQRGVACESCHGPSEKWEGLHWRTDWRAKPVAEKESLGMVDVRNPIKRAEQCFSCHIGNVAQGKIITHDMYAAGHPPLPSIEIESFARQMPRHWRYLNEKDEQNEKDEKRPFKLREEFVRENHQYLVSDANASIEPVAEHHHGAAAVVLGGVLALRESVELLGDMAAGSGPAWPELSALNCAACHHELATPSWRQQNGGRSRPGRPTMPEWPTALTRLAIGHTAPDRAGYELQLAALNSKLDAVRAEFEATPFGRPNKLRTACANLSNWLTANVACPVAAKPFDQPSLQRSVDLLLIIGSTETHDYDSARQIAWALRTLYCEYRPAQSADARVNKLLRDVSWELRLDLTNAPPESCLAVAPMDLAARELVSLTKDLSSSLQTAASYDPKSFRKQMQDIKEAKEKSQ